MVSHDPLSNGTSRSERLDTWRTKRIDLDWNFFHSEDTHPFLEGLDAADREFIVEFLLNEQLSLNLDSPTEPANVADRVRERARREFNDARQRGDQVAARRMGALLIRLGLRREQLMHLATKCWDWLTGEPESSGVAHDPA
jgi:hypothetical protein